MSKNELDSQPKPLKRASSRALGWFILFSLCFSLILVFSGTGNAQTKPGQEEKNTASSKSTKDEAGKVDDTGKVDKTGKQDDTGKESDGAETAVEDRDNPDKPAEDSEETEDADAKDDKDIGKDSKSNQENQAHLIQATSPDGRVLIVDAEFLNFFRDEDYWVVFLHGNVQIRFDGAKIFADSVVLWYDYSDSQRLLKMLDGEQHKYGYLTPGLWDEAEPDTLGPLPFGGSGTLDPPKAMGAVPWAGDPVEFYAEGSVKITEKDACLYAEQLYTNIAEKRGTLLSGELFGTAEISKRKNPIHFKADTIRKICDQLYVMEELSFTTCVFHIPHYELSVDYTELKGSFTDGVLSTRDARIRLRGLPIPLPDTSVNIGRNWYFPIKRVKLGSSARRGQYFLLTLKEDFDHLGTTFNNLVGIDAPCKGDVEFQLDLMTKRGVGLGPLFEYESPGYYKGYLTGYYIHDSADADRGNIPIENSDRGRIRTQNRLNLSENTLLDLELSYLSDHHFLDEYYEREFKTDKEQETYAYLHHNTGSQHFGLLTRFRLNDFHSQNEYLPQATWDVTPTPLFDSFGDEPVLGLFDTSNIYYSHNAEISQVRNRPDERILVNSDRLTRADYRQIFEMPVTMGPVKITPFYINRLSYFERIANDAHATGRVVETFGARAGMLFHRDSDFVCDWMNIDHTRNIIEPAVTYGNNFAITEERHDLINFDEMEDPVRGDYVNLELHHRFQTRNPDAAPSNTLLPNHTILHTLIRQPIHPDKRSSATRHKLGITDYYTEFTPISKHRWIGNPRLIHQGQYDPNDINIIYHNTMLSFDPHADYRLSVWYGWIRRRFEYYGFSVRKLLTDKWEVEYILNYDLEFKKTGDQSLSIRRRAHQWLFELTAAVDSGDKDQSLMLSITPLALFSWRKYGSIYQPMSQD